MGLQWKDLFNTHRGERLGFLWLMTGCLIAAAWGTYEQWLRPSDPNELSILAARMEPWVEARKAFQDSTNVAPFSHDRRLTLFPFDPNHLPIDQWVALGLSERQAEALHKYEAGGGRFRSKRDVAKMRVVDPELYAQWAPYIQLPDSAASAYPHTTWPEREDRTYAERTALRGLELNSADSAALVAVPGIGPAFARGILKYREKLGGYHSLDQLTEVYVLKDKPEAVAKLKGRLVLDTLMVRRLPVNSATTEELAAHPYLGWKVAKALVAYRGQHGAFRNVADIKGCVLVNDSLFRKLAPYLTAP
ncbi:MAG: helix-hairpin-helix domain-containing protein [Flavobacteriales bacterium]|nr:helix-hairpin-helix domain-containing protein [Flavobacteriales bacterium]